MKLFISYSRDDAQWVNDLQRALDEDGHSAWIDRRNIPSTVDWWHAICKGIAEAECFLYVMTEKSVDSIYCRGELDYALSRQMPILPLMLKKCELPPILRNKRVQYQQLSPDMNMD
ncbi:MAG: toll/interleukin-1 receptor domain-containing protein, partial [Phototrophicaceae bacterium]